MATVTLGITGGIAAYKIPDLIRQFRKLGIEIHCIVTETALRFVTAETLAVVSETDVVVPATSGSSIIRHLHARQSSDLMVVAPATANFVAKAVAGLADSPLLSAFLAFPGRKLIVPAMHDTMWLNPATQRNITQLEAWGVEIIGPDTGALASGDFGVGRMIDSEFIILKAQLMLLGTPRLNDRRVMVGLGGTREAIDPVRVISNLSTGKLGSTLAHALALQGAKVSVVSTIPQAKNPHIANVQMVSSAQELKSGISEIWPNQDILYMPAAVSDFKPAHQSSDKIKRSSRMTIELDPTEDIIGGLVRLPHQRIVGFCLESDTKLRESAIQKLKTKRLDAIVANTPTQFGSDTRDFWVITPHGETEYTGLSLVETASVLIALGNDIF